MQSRWYHVPKIHSLLDGHERKVNWLELFYDLIYVATLIQLGNALSANIGQAPLAALLGFAALFWPLWYTWTGFTFFSNRFIVDDFLHRLMIFVQMFCVGAVAIVIPQVLEGEPLLFSLHYAAARWVLVLLYLRSYLQVPEARDIARIFSGGFAVGAVMWTVSAFLPFQWAVVLWGVAMVWDVVVPLTPKANELAQERPLDILHFSERYGLLTLIVLGESFVKVLGQLSSHWHVVSPTGEVTFVPDGVTTPDAVMCAMALSITCSIWWIYFDDVAGSRIKRRRMASIVWIYAHLPMMAAVTATGVAIKKVVLLDPMAMTNPKYGWFLCGALALVFLSVGVIDAVTERRQAELSDRARVNMRFCSALVLLALASTASFLPVWAFTGIVSLVCVLQVVFDLWMAPLFEDEHAMHAEVFGSVQVQEHDNRAPNQPHLAVKRPLRRDLAEAVRKNTPDEMRRDLYFFFMEGSWWRLLGATTLLYVIANGVFAALYMLEPGSVANVEPQSFMDAFYFSVQTMTTIGYGAMAPESNYAHALVTIEAGLAVVGVALVTGIAFAKMARPQRGVLFSKVAVVHQHHGVPMLQMRVGNARGNDIVEANVRLAVLKDDFSPEGVHMRRLHELKLVRHRTPLFTLTWTIFHPIDEESPLYGLTSENIDEQLLTLIITMTGYDATYAQTTHARHVYFPEDVRFGERFVDILDQLPDGRMMIDYSHFHHTTALPTGDVGHHESEAPDQVAPDADEAAG